MMAYPRFSILLGLTHLMVIRLSLLLGYGLLHRFTSMVCCSAALLLCRPPQARQACGENRIIRRRVGRGGDRAVVTVGSSTHVSYSGDDPSQSCPCDISNGVRAGDRLG